MSEEGNREAADAERETDTPRRPKAGDLPPPARAVDDADTLIGMGFVGGSGELHAAGQTFTRDQLKETHERIFGEARRIRRIEMGIDPEPSSNQPTEEGRGDE
ncbi:hypothetical protein HJD18_12445 [Thermoleophilia bacterium SCSIO 60948]|nr:hypothetical protein HJD18_12445 [Thermoleophilia bacterium SCSIO 60948]